MTKEFKNVTFIYDKDDCDLISILNQYIDKRIEMILNFFCLEHVGPVINIVSSNKKTI